MLSNLVAIQQSFYAMRIPTNEVSRIRLGFLRHFFTSENCWNGEYSLYEFVQTSWFQANLSCSLTVNKRQTCDNATALPSFSSTSAGSRHITTGCTTYKQGSLFQLWAVVVARPPFDLNQMIFFTKTWLCRDFKPTLTRWFKRSLVQNTLSKVLWRSTLWA